MKSSKSLNVKYSLIQGLMCVAICAMLGYASVFLLSRGFSNPAIGVVISISSIIATVLQPVFASIVSKTKIILKDFISLIMSVGVILSILAYFVESQIILSIIIILLAGLVMGVMPLITSLTFEYEKNGYKINFGLARGIGSASYAIMSLLLGELTKRYNPSVIPLFYIISTLGLFILVYSFRIPKEELIVVNDKSENKKEEIEIGMMQFIKKYKKFMILVLGVTLIFIDHSIFNNFTIQIVQDLGGDSSQMGRAIFIAAILELPVMIYFMKLKEKIKCSKLMMVAAIAFSIKHIIIFIANNMAMIYVAQILQAASYALYVPASVYYVSQIISKKDSIKGQSIIGGAVSLASVVASLGGGFLLESMGSKNLLLLGAIISVLGTVLVCISLENHTVEERKNVKINS